MELQSGNGSKSNLKSEEELEAVSQSSLRKITTNAPQPPQHSQEASPDSSHLSVAFSELVVSEDDLIDLFKEAKDVVKHLENESSSSLQDDIHRGIGLLQKVSQGIRRLAVFSKNEEASDINTEDLQFVLCEYYLAQLYMKIVGGKVGVRSAVPEVEGSKVATANPKVIRLSSIKKALASYDHFLNLCDSLKILDSNDKKAHEQVVKGEKVDASTKRQLKIDRYKRSRACKVQLDKTDKEIECQRSKGNVVDEELLRQSVLLLISNCIRSTLDSYVIAQDEMQMLEQMLRSERVPTLREVQDEASQMQNKGIEITKINADFTIKRETLKDGVFRPSWRQPTVSLEEYAEIEVQRAKARAAKEQERIDSGAELESVRYEHLLEKALEDDSKLVDKATLNDRAWDNWKDDNPRGSGVTKRY